MVRYLTRHDIGTHPDDYRHTLSYSGLTLTLASLTGHEVQRRTFLPAVQLLNRAVHLGMDETDEQMMGLMLTQLRHTTRFGGDSRITRVKGENSATHSCQCVVLANDIFTQARHVVQEGSQQILTPLFDERGHALSAYAAQLRQVVGLSLLIHDCGEMLGEFSTVAQRWDGGPQTEKAELERIITQFSLELALHAVETGKPQVFLNTMARLKKAVGLEKNGEPRKVSDEDVQMIMDLLDRERGTFQLSELSTRRVGQWMELYDLAEFKEKPRDARYESQLSHLDWPFLGNFIKALEHCQGSRHLVRFAERDDRIKSRDRQTRILGDTPTRALQWTLNYNEAELPVLFRSLAEREHALLSRPAIGRSEREERGELDVEEALARSLAGRIYDTQRELFKHVPPLLDRVPESADKQKSKQDARRIANKLARNMGFTTRKGRTDIPAFRQEMGDVDQRAKMKARGTLTHVYERAAHLVRTGAYVPADRCLVEAYLAESLPPEFEYAYPFPNVLVHAAEHQGSQRLGKGGRTQ
jgi:hypothetical protein